VNNVECLFCGPNPDRIFLSNDLCHARWDSYPVSEGHALIVPSRHFPDYFDVTSDERVALWNILEDAKEIVREKYNPDGFNIGVNVGVAAGQSVFHLHIHLIPRYTGDTGDPKGGVRGVISD